MAMSLENKKDVIILDMDEQIYILARELKEEIDRDPRFIRLSELEKKMSENEEVMLLSYKKDVANAHYNDVLKIYKEDDEECLKARKELIQRKDELDAHPLVKDYLSALNEVRQILFEMNNIIFGDFKEDKR